MKHLETFLLMTHNVRFLGKTQELIDSSLETKFFQGVPGSKREVNSLPFNL